VAVEVDPGMAFGTGTHETTRLCLEWLDQSWRGGSLLDVGTGTGILAIAAALLAPGSRVEAVDVDPLAVDIARENARINGVASHIVLRAGGLEALDGCFDVVLANLTADVLVDLADGLTARVCPRGKLVVSGILAGQEGGVSRAFEARGHAVEFVRYLGEWVAIVLGRK
jgi:ribosomal protein L11 methyltransferase